MLANTIGRLHALADQVPVWVSNVSTPLMPDMIRSVGQMTDTSLAATNLVDQIQQEFLPISRITKARTLYLIWMIPDGCGVRDIY